MNSRILELIQPTHPQSYGNMGPARLRHVLEYVLKWSRLPEDMTHEEQVALLHELISQAEIENGEGAYRLTEDGEKVLCYFLFGSWATQL